MKRVCIYGKGGVGKSTTVSNVAVALAESGKKVMVIGCDPKGDSTRNIMGKKIPTVLDVLRKKGDNIQLEDVVFKGSYGIYCVESGGPEPGIGCAGRGIIKAIEILDRLNVFETLKPEVTIYDVLGDVVCGGFAMPLQRHLADEVYIVTTCDPMAIYAANNICKGIKRYAHRGSIRLGGIVYNGRSVVDDISIVSEFASRLGTEVIGYIPMSEILIKSEVHKKTVIEYSPDHPISNIFRELGRRIFNNSRGVIPNPLSEEELDRIWKKIERLIEEGCEF